MLRIVASGSQRCGPDTAATPHDDTKERWSCSHRSSTAGTATLPTGSGTRGSCLLDGPSPPTSPSSSPPRTRGDYPPLTTTSPPSNGAHGLSTTTRACPARRARADAHGSSVWGHLFASLPPCKTAGSYTQTEAPARGVPVWVSGVCAVSPLVVMCAGRVPGRCRRVYLSIPGRGCEIAPTRTPAPRTFCVYADYITPVYMCGTPSWAPPALDSRRSEDCSSFFFCYHKLNVRDTLHQRPTNQ